MYIHDALYKQMSKEFIIIMLQKLHKDEGMRDISYSLS